MNPAFLTMLWPVLEGAVGHHVKSKRQVEAIMTAVRGKIDEGLSGEMEMQKLSHQRQHQLNQIALQKRSLFLSGWRPLAGWSCALGVAWVFFGGADSADGRNLFWHRHPLARTANRLFV